MLQGECMRGWFVRRGQYHLVAEGAMLRGRLLYGLCVGCGGGKPKLPFRCRAPYYLFRGGAVLETMNVMITCVRIVVAAREV